MALLGICSNFAKISVGFTNNQTNQSAVLIGFSHPALIIIYIYLYLTAKKKKSSVWRRSSRYHNLLFYFYDCRIFFKSFLTFGAVFGVSFIMRMLESSQNWAWKMHWLDAAQPVNVACRLFDQKQSCLTMNDFSQFNQRSMVHWFNCVPLLTKQSISYEKKKHKL